MSAQNVASIAGPIPARGSATWLWISILAVLLAALGSVIALAVQRIYAPLTPAFFPQALAQDTANLALVAPAWLILAALALRGSLRAEQFDDKDGFKFGAANNTIMGYTLTVGYAPESNFELRGEVRQDQADKKVYTKGGNATDTQTYFAVEGLYKF